MYKGEFHPKGLFIKLLKAIRIIISNFYSLIKEHAGVKKTDQVIFFKILLGHDISSAIPYQSLFSSLFSGQGN